MRHIFCTDSFSGVLQPGSACDVARSETQSWAWQVQRMEAAEKRRADEVQRRVAQQVWCSERQNEKTVQLCGDRDLAGLVLSDLI